jgi:periplasmic copper chaperone A
MSMSRTTARLFAVPVTAAAVTLLAAAPAGAHVTGSPSDATAGAFTVLTMSVPHGCDGSPTTRIEIQIPESVLSVTPTRNPLYDVETTTEQLDEPITDEDGNEITERTGTVVYTAKTPLPDGQRDTFELSFQVPDAAGEMLAFPTVQTCEQGQTGWVEVPEEGQDAEELEHPAPAFEILPADDGDAAAQTSADTQEASATTEESGSDALGWAGLVAGLLGLLVGGVALARSRATR